MWLVVILLASFTIGIAFRVWKGEHLEIMEILQCAIFIILLCQFFIQMRKCRRNIGERR